MLWEDLIHIKLVWMKTEPFLTQMSLMSSVLALVWLALISNYKKTIVYLQLSAKWESFSHQLACFVLLYLSPLLIYFISVSGFGIFEKYGKVGRFVRHKSHDKILMEWNPSGNECCLGIKGFLIPWKGHSVTALCSWSAHWWQHFRHKRRLWWRGTSPLFYFSIPH